MLRFLHNLAHLIPSFSSLYYSWNFSLHSEFLSSTHKQLFNFLLLQDKEKEDEEDDDENDETLDLIRVRVVTRNCGNTKGSFLRLLLTTSSCINW